MKKCLSLLLLLFFSLGCSSSNLEDTVNQIDKEARETAITIQNISQYSYSDKKYKPLTSNTDGSQFYLTFDPENETNTVQIQLSGTANDNGGIDRIEIYKDEILQEVSSGIKNWKTSEISLDLSSNESSYSFCAKVINNLGNSKKYCTELIKQLQPLSGSMTSMSFGTCHFYEEKIYCLGGIGSVSILDIKYIYIYDTVNNTWSKRTASSAPFASMYRFAFSGVLLNEKIYIFGGIGKNGPNGFNKDDPNNYYTDAYVYNITSNTWSEVPGGHSFEKRHGLNVVELKGKIYIFGGFYLNIGIDMPTAVEVYNPADDSLSSAAPLSTTGSPQTRAYAGAVSDGNYIYAVSGFNLNNGFLRTVIRYNPISNQWENMAPLPESSIPRAGFATAFIENKYLYIFGGNNLGVEIALIDKYDTVDNNWENVEQVYYPYYGGSFCSTQNALYLIGGITNGSAHNKMYLYNPPLNP